MCSLTKADNSSITYFPWINLGTANTSLTILPVINYVRHLTFYALDSFTNIEKIFCNCNLCQSLNSLPQEMIPQSITTNPLMPRVQFTVDALCCAKHKILGAHGIFSSYTTALFIPNETADTPIFEILNTTSYVQPPKTMIHVSSTIVYKGVPACPFVRHPNLNPAYPLFKIFVSHPFFSVPSPFMVFHTTPSCNPLLP